MLDTFKARLKAKSTAAGVNNLTSKRLDAMSARLDKLFPDLTEEKDHDEKIDLLYAADDFKELGAFDDHQRTKAARDAKQNGQQQNTNQSQNQDSSQNNSQQQSQQADDMPSWFKPFAEKLTKIESEKTQQTLRQKAADLLKDVPERFWSKRAMPESEEGLAEWAEEVKTDFGELVKESSDKGLAVLSTQKPGGGSAAGTVGDKAISPDIKAFVDKSKPQQATNK